MLTRRSAALALAPLALLAACGGSGSQEDSASPAASPAPSPAPAADPAPAPATPVAAAAPTGEVPAAFAICKSCHAVEAGKNGIGPTLFAIVGSKAGEVPGFNFSPALKSSGIVWDRAKLDTWLQGPMKMVPGTRMVISVPNAEARTAIIDYLETLK
ncbi:cytochrome c family protein [Novosphingobium colocasiae]|uniref:c-type cytochrome n=1 Tax=Novosphingobium colocasiae TaxID=1256513 RepID=UPI0035B32E05